MQEISDPLESNPLSLNMKQALGGSATQDRRKDGQQSFRIRKFSRQGSLSRRSGSLSQRGDDDGPEGDLDQARGMSTSARKIAKDMSKTIDSEDEDGIVQHREKSRATRMREEVSSMKDSIRLTNINVPKHLD